MNYKRMGGSGLKVSEFCLGCLTFGDQTDQQEGIGMVHRALDAGVNFFDTANGYTGGRSEEILGNALKGHRESVVIATKVYAAVGDGPNDRGLSRKHIMKAVEDSLRRLQTDYIDLYQMHAPDHETPLDESLSALDTLVNQGKVRYVGCSNFAAWQVCKALWIGETKNLCRVDCVQVMYNLLARRIEQELLPFCLTEGVGVIVYNPLAGGLLTGKHKKGEPPREGTRFARRDLYVQRYWHGQNFDAIEDLSAIAQKAGRTLIELALGWILGSPAITAAIVGASSLSQLEQNLKAFEWRPSNEELDACDAIWEKYQGIAPHYNR